MFPSLKKDALAPYKLRPEGPPFSVLSLSVAEFSLWPENFHAY